MSPMLGADLDRVRALADKLKHDCLPGAWLSERLGVGSERLAAWRRSGEVFALPLPADMLYDCLYPVWQFGETRPHAGVQRVVSEAERLGLDAADLYLALTQRPGLAVKGEPATRFAEPSDVEVALGRVRQAAEAKQSRSLT